MLMMFLVTDDDDSCCGCFIFLNSCWWWLWLYIITIIIVVDNDDDGDLRHCWDIALQVCLSRRIAGSHRKRLQNLIFFALTHRIHGTGIFTYIWLIFMVDVGGKYTIHGSQLEKVRSSCARLDRFLVCWCSIFRDLVNNGTMKVFDGHFPETKQVWAWKSSLWPFEQANHQSYSIPKLFSLTSILDFRDWILNPLLRLRWLVHSLETSFEGVKFQTC